jgi:hypothetical protein
MTKIYNIYQRLHSNTELDELTKHIYKGFLKQYPLSWVKVDFEYCPSYYAVDGQGKDYLRITSTKGNTWKVTEGKFFGVVFPSDSRSETLHLSDAFKYAEEILFNVGLSAGARPSKK